MAVPVSFDMESPAWLRNLRWAAILGMSASVVGASLLGTTFSLSKIYVLLGALALWNLLLPVMEERMLATSKGFVFLQIVVDLVVLFGILWLSGGLVNPFVSFFVLHVLIAGLLLNTMLTFLVSFLAATAVLILISAPGLEVGGVPVSLRSSPIWFGIPIGLILLIFFTNGFILVFLDRLGHAQEQLRQRVKMDALGRLVAGLAHEIGTPLNSILLLSKDLEFSASDEQKKDLGVIASQAKRCGEIVSLLLGYSQTFVRRGEDVKYTPIRLVDWIQEIFDLLGQSRRLPPEKMAQVKFRVEAHDLPEKVRVPELILHQVTENLLKNALDAVRGVPEPEVNVEVYEDHEENELVLIVQDNGSGFSKEEQERAFEAFFSTKEVGKGSGLGLYISYYLLSQVGGRISIEPRPGPGARMRVALPHLEGDGQQEERTDR